MAALKRCRVPMSIAVGDRVEHLWPGLEVDLDRELAPGFTLGHAVAGRADCFEDLGTPDPVADQLSTTDVPASTLRTRTRGRAETPAEQE